MSGNEAFEIVSERGWQPRAEHHVAQWARPLV